jgi:GNAT superfamily N-acetyltransferase
VIRRATSQDAEPIAAVHVAARLGAALLEAAVAGGACELWVYVHNPPARAFYERRGWVAEPGSESSDPGWGLPVPALSHRLP